MEEPNLSQEINELHASLCSALADPKRIIILYILSEQPKNVGDLAAILGVSQPTVSRHLKMLREQSLVRAVRQGPNVEYSLVDHRLIDALDLLREVLRDRIQHRAKLLDVDSAV